MPPVVFQINLSNVTPQNSAALQALSAAMNPPKPTPWLREAPAAPSALQKMFSSANSSAIGQMAGTVSGAAGGGLTGGIAGGIAGQALGSLGPAGLALMVGFDLASKGVHKFAETVNEFVARGAELAKYSGSISGARASANVRGILADIREANALGDSTASLTDAQSRLMTEIRDILLPIKRWVAEKLAGIMEQIADGIEDVGPQLTAMMELWTGVVDILIDFANADFGKMMEDGNNTLARIHQALAKEREPADQLMMEFFSAFGQENTPGLNSPADPMDASLRQKLNQPGLRRP